MSWMRCAGNWKMAKLDWYWTECDNTLRGVELGLSGGTHMTLTCLKTSWICTLTAQNIPSLLLNLTMCFCCQCCVTKANISNVEPWPASYSCLKEGLVLALDAIFVHQSSLSTLSGKGSMQKMLVCDEPRWQHVGMYYKTEGTRINAEH